MALSSFFCLLSLSLLLLNDCCFCTDYRIVHIAECNSTLKSQKWNLASRNHQVKSVITDEGCLSCFLRGCRENDMLQMTSCSSHDDDQHFQMVPVEREEDFSEFVHIGQDTCISYDSLTEGALARVVKCTTHSALWHYYQRSKQIKAMRTGEEGQSFCLERAPQFYDPWPCSNSDLPSGYVCGCLRDGVSSFFPFCNVDLPVEDRVSDLISRLTLTEKQGFLSSDLVHTEVDDCSNMDAGASRLGIPPNLNLVETNSAVSSVCLGRNKCPTEFPAPACLAASFNRSVWHYKGTVISTELRAMSNLHNVRRSSPKAFVGQMGFGPNINIVRDPRFGRNSELPSEDPTLAGLYASYYVQGMQVGEDRRYLKMVSGLKHFTAYSVESGRSVRNYNISIFDLFDTYLAQYKLAFTRGNAMAMMCSYSAVNGVPMCAHDYLINKVVRQSWGRPDVLTVTDCGAVNNMVSFMRYVSTPAEGAAAALKGGVDIDLGDPHFSPENNGGTSALSNALSSNLVTEEELDQALSRVFNLRFRIGQFDPEVDQPYTNYGPAHVNMSRSWDLVLDSALQGLVLLKNDKNILPLATPEKKDKVLIVGPHCCSKRDLFEGYAGDQICEDGSVNCVESIGEAFERLHPGHVKTISGVDIGGNNTGEAERALAEARKTQVIILALGIGRTQEREGIDRTQITLPGRQQEFALEILKLNKPTILVLVSGGVVAIDKLVEPAPAIIQAFYPAYRTGEALYRSIYGYENRWGKLPVTMYRENYIQEVGMYDFDMSGGAGRTYRYYQNEPLFPFGFGLSYATFDFDCEPATPDPGAVVSVLCRLTNVGERSGDEVLILYHSVGDEIRNRVDHPVPRKQLVDFQRIQVDPTDFYTFSFEVPLVGLSLTNLNGDKLVYSGNHILSVENGLASSQLVYFQHETVVAEPSPHSTFSAGDTLS